MLDYHPAKSELKIKHLIIAVLISIGIHFASVLAINTDNNKVVPRVATKVIIGNSSYQDAHNLQEIASVLLEESPEPVVKILEQVQELSIVELNAQEVAYDAMERLNSTIALIELSQPSLAVLNTTEVTKLAFANTTKLSTINNLKTVTVKNIIPTSSKNLEVKPPKRSISYIKTRLSIAIQTQSALEIVPDVNNPNNLLLGIDESFTKKMTQKLTIGLSQIKSELKTKKIYGKIQVQFTINRAGKLTSSKIVKSTNKKLSKLVLKMLRVNSPYDALPEKYIGDALKFSYPIEIKIK